MQNFEIEMCRDLPSKDAFSGLVARYYDLVVERIQGMGLEIDPEAPKSALAEFWANSDDYLPPNGCLVVARNNAGHIIGCGILKRLDQDTG